MPDPSRPGQHRFYDDLAVWWPLISPLDEYAEEAACMTGVLQRAAIPVREVLELGSGGGSNAFYLKAAFTLTLVDLSGPMLDVSLLLNPECDHQQGDMRTVRLGRSFDAVFVHDAVDYMTTEADLLRTMGSAFAHCRKGGIALFVPDCTTETFEASTDHGGSDATDGRGVRLLEWVWDPDPDDTWVLVEYAFVLRDVDGAVEVVHETHRNGVFGRRDWLRLLSAAGFEAEAITEVTTDDRPPRELFIGHKPL